MIHQRGVTSSFIFEYLLVTTVVGGDVFSIVVLTGDVSEKYIIMTLLLTTHNA